MAGAIRQVGEAKFFADGRGLMQASGANQFFGSAPGATILAVAFPLMFASYELVVRHSFIGLVLNGRRVPRSTAMRSIPVSVPMNSTPQSDSV
jgi:hypothetical protein